MRSWHDYHIIGHSVDGLTKQVRLKLLWPYDSEVEIKSALLVFSGVEGYFFEHDLGTNIILDLVEIPLLDFLTEWTERFESECKWGWPRFWRAKSIPREAPEQVLQEAYTGLTATQIKCFELSSSYGMSGWVLANKVEHIEVQT